MPEGQVGTRQKKAVIERAGGCCEYCRSQSRFAVQPFSVEHIVPRSKGGETALDSLALACQGCNNHKYNKTEGRDPVNGSVVPLYHPRKQQWSDYFTWNNFTLIIRLTPIGRATVEALQLNREGVVNLRQALLYMVGEHPPARPDE